MSDEPQTTTPEQDEPTASTEPETQAEEAQAEEKLEQTVKIEDAGPARKKIEIEIPQERIQAKIAENMQDLKEEAVLPGFRRGRAPMRLIEKRFGSDVRREVKNQILAESYSQVIEENDLRVLGEPDIKDLEEIELPEAGPLQVEVEIEVAPEFELPDVSDIELKKKKVQVTDEQVDQEIERFREMRGGTQEVDGPCQTGDYLTADVEVRDAEGQVLEERPATQLFVPGESRKFKGVVAGILVEDLGKQLDGHGAGETVTIEATGPERHENEALQGKPLKIDVNIKSVERLEAAPIEQVLELAGFDSLDELKEQVRTNLEQRAESEQQADLQQQLTDALLERIEIDLPEGLSEKQTERVVQRRTIDMMYRGASQQDIEENIAELRSASEAEAQRELKLFFILNKVAEKYDVEVGEGELNGRIAQMAIQSGRRPEKMRQEMARSGRLEQLYIQLREQKALEKLMEQVHVVEVEPGEAEAAEEGEAPSGGEGEKPAES